MYTQRSLRASLGGALVAGVAMVALGLQDAAPAPLSVLFDTTRTRTVADQQAVAAQHQQEAVAAPAPAPAPAAAPAAPAAPAVAPPAAAPKPALPAEPVLVGPVAPPASAMPTGPVIRVAPGQSISSAVAKAKPGDTVLVSGGTYPGGLDVQSDGADGKPITIQAVPGQRVVITGSASGNGLVSFSGHSNITMIGITVQGSDKHGMYSQNAKNITLRDCEIDGSQDGGIVFLQSSNIKVQRCDIHGTNARGTSAENEAVSMDHTTGFEVSFSKVHNNGEEGIDAKYDSNGGKIFNNTVNGNRGPNIYVDSAQDVEVFNNVVTGTTEDSKAGIAVAVESLSDTRKASNIKIYNNVVKNNAGGGIGFWIESSGTFSGIQILNNTVVGNSKGGLNIDSASFAGSNVLRNNIFSGNSSDVAGNAGSFEADHNLFGSGGLGSNLVKGALAFVDKASNLRLSNGSAGVGAGSADGAPGFDITGVKRAGSIDIGAYQIPPPVDPTAIVADLTGQVSNLVGQITANVATSVLGSGQRAASPVPAGAAAPAGSPAPAGAPAAAPAPAATPGQ